MSDRWLIVVDYEEGRPEVVLDLPGGHEDEESYRAAADRAAAYHGAPVRLMSCRVVHQAGPS